MSGVRFQYAFENPYTFLVDVYVNVNHSRIARFRFISRWKARAHDIQG